MGKKIIAVFALVALLAMPAFASVQNVKVGGSIKTTSVIRDNFNLGKTLPNASQNVFLSQAYLNVDADLTDNVSTKLGLKNERVWGANIGNNDIYGSTAVNMETAYVTMKELLYSPLTVSIGRQPLSYGNEFLVGKQGWINQSGALKDLTGDSNFDAIKAVLSYDPLTVDLFASKITEKSDPSTEDKGDTNLYGINANYKLGDKMSTVVEGYTFVKMNKNMSTTTISTKENTVYAPGLRVSTNPIEGLNVQLEGTYEFGKTYPNSPSAATSLSAFGVQGMVNYALPVMKDMNPVLSGTYTYLSGDKDYGTADDNGKDARFNSLYENQNTGRIYDSLFPMNNLSIFNAAVEVAPMKDLTTKLSWTGLYQVQKTEAYSLNSPIADTTGGSVGVKRSNRLGNEVDLDLNYAYTEDVTFGLTGGMFFAGTKITNADGNNDIAKQLLTSVNVAF